MPDQNINKGNILNRQFEGFKPESPQNQNEGKPENKINQPSLNRIDQNLPEQREGEAGTEIKSTTTTNAQQQTLVKNEELIEIEKILESGLNDLIVNLPEYQQREFINRGEKAAQEIEVLIHEAKIKVFKIIEVIIKWLQSIPGANKFFIEKEAKIKADQVIKIKRGF